MIDDLTEGEKKIVELVARGRSNKGIAAELGISKDSIRQRLRTIYSKYLIEGDEQINKRVVLALKIKATEKEKE